MKRVELINITLVNFKAVTQASYDFDGKDTIIRGSNGSGKTTIYEAYYWCLFGKTLASNGIVQTLDKDNIIVHNVDTSVMVTLRIDNEYNISIKRILSEKWKNERLMGTETKVQWNDVPVSLIEFKRKIEDIVPFKIWQMLSNNATFMSLKTDERRKMLLSLASIDQEAIVQHFPCVKKAFSENKTIEELNMQTKVVRKNASKELGDIPAKISAQMSLKVDNTACTNLQDVANVEQYLAKEKELVLRIESYNHDWNNKHNKRINDLRAKRIRLEDTLLQAENTKRTNENEQQSRISKLADITERFNQAKNEWLRVNNESFSFENADTCPVCGAKLSQEYKQKRYLNAVEEYNKNKSERLDNIMRKAQELSQQKAVLSGTIKAYNDIKSNNDKASVVNAEDELEKLSKEYESLSNASIDNDTDYCELRKALEVLKSDKPNDADDIVAQRTNEEINKRIDTEVEKLKTSSLELSQSIANCDKIINEIFDYKKAQIEAAEKEVNSMFQNVVWKFYAKNVTNDELQEICDCIVDGVDYNNLNHASKVNAEIDIINAMSKHFEIEVPCWIDNKESVSSVLNSNQQQIMLEVAKNTKLSINQF